MLSVSMLHPELRWGWTSPRGAPRQQLNFMHRWKEKNSEVTHGHVPYSWLSGWWDGCSQVCPGCHVNLHVSQSASTVLFPLLFLASFDLGFSFMATTFSFLLYVHMSTCGVCTHVQICLFVLMYVWVPPKSGEILCVGVGVRDNSGTSCRGPQNV